jgi:hypothetical protein
MKPYIDSPEEDAIREQNYRARIDRLTAIEADRVAAIQQQIKANAVQKQTQINAENDRLLEIYKAYCNSVRYQVVMSFGEWVSQYKQNILSAGW